MLDCDVKVWAVIRKVAMVMTMNTMMNGRFMTIVDSVLLVGEGGLVMTGSVEGRGRD